MRFQATARDGGRVLHGRKVVAEIKRLALIHFVPQPGASSLVGADVGVPFYWRQYGNHQDPERRMDFRRRLTLIEQSATAICLRATGTTRSGSARSTYAITFRIDARGRLQCEVEAVLTVSDGPGWLVTPHPHHGEAVFCTLWPTGVFSPTRKTPKRFDSCLMQRGEKGRRILHHHLESPDKQRIKLGSGDRFAWGLEEMNPQLTIGAGTRAEAGVCAYMWDTHFALRVCRDQRDVVLKPGSELRAAYALEGKTRRQLAADFNCATIASSGAAAATPMYRRSLHTFKETFRDATAAGNTAWPWQREIVAGREADVVFARDTRVGCGDCWSLKIQHRHAAQSRWLATTLGPAFGEPAFKRGARLRLGAMVKTTGAAAARITLRWHRTGRGSVFDVSGYEMWSSEWVGSRGALAAGSRKYAAGAPRPQGDGIGGAGDWIELLIETPPLSPAPDRVHLLLELKGRGAAWFDNVELQRR